MSPKVQIRTCVAVLDTMWDWQGATSGAGYRKAPRYFLINPRNFTGRRLYNWLGPKGKYFDRLWVTDACKELVYSPSDKGTLDPEWLAENLERLKPFDLCLVCGKRPQSAFRLSSTVGIRTLYVPHPAARIWTKKALAKVGWHVRHGSRDLEFSFRGGRIVAEPLIPF